MTVAPNMSRIARTVRIVLDRCARRCTRFCRGRLLLTCERIQRAIGNATNSSRMGSPRYALKRLRSFSSSCGRRKCSPSASRTSCTLLPCLRGQRGVRRQALAPMPCRFMSRDHRRRNDIGGRRGARCGAARRRSRRLRCAAAAVAPFTGAAGARTPELCTRPRPAGTRACAAASSRTRARSPAQAQVATAENRDLVVELHVFRREACGQPLAYVRCLRLRSRCRSGTSLQQRQRLSSAARSSSTCRVVGRELVELAAHRQQLASRRRREPALDDLATACASRVPSIGRASASLTLPPPNAITWSSSDSASRMLPSAACATSRSAPARTPASRPASILSDAR